MHAIRSRRILRERVEDRHLDAVDRKVPRLARVRRKIARVPVGEKPMVWMARLDGDEAKRRARHVGALRVPRRIPVALVEGCRRELLPRPRTRRQHIEIRAVSGEEREALRGGDRAIYAVFARVAVRLREESLGVVVDLPAASAVLRPPHARRLREHAVENARVGSVLHELDGRLFGELRPGLAVLGGEKPALEGFRRLGLLVCRARRGNEPHPRRVRPVADERGRKHAGEAHRTPREAEVVRLERALANRRGKKSVRAFRVGDEHRAFCAGAVVPSEHARMDKLHRPPRVVCAVESAPLAAPRPAHSEDGAIGVRRMHGNAAHHARSLPVRKCAVKHVPRLATIVAAEHAANVARHVDATRVRRRPGGLLEVSPAAKCAARPASVHAMRRRCRDERCRGKSGYEDHGGHCSISRRQNRSIPRAS